MEETTNASSCCNEEDRISRLPDELIHHILSFIDTKYAVQTSHLSKRWIGIWKSLPFLKFVRKSFPQGKEHDQTFIDFVDMVFIHRDDNSDIQKFGLDWYHLYKFNDDDIATVNVNRWIVHAVKSNVQEMTLTFCKGFHSAYEIPHQLLNCKSLRKLGLCVFAGGPYADIILPGSMNLPQLKVLCLLELSIPNVELAKRLFLSCPVLERLRMVDCNIQTDNQKNLIVDSLSLKKFEYDHCLKRRLRRNDTMVNVIKLCAPNLEDITCGSFFTRDYSLENCSPLSGVTFDMRLKKNREDESAETYSELPSMGKFMYARRMMKFLATVHMVKELSLSAGFLEVLSQALEISDCQLARLCNLKRLKLDMWFTWGSLRSVAYILKISPNIHTILLTSKESNLVDVGDSWEAGLSFQGMLSHLESVQINQVEGCDNELKFLKSVLRYAMVLKKVVLYPRSTIDSPDRVREQFLDKLRELPRASSHIIMHWPATKGTYII